MENYLIEKVCQENELGVVCAWLGIWGDGVEVSRKGSRSITVVTISNVVTIQYSKNIVGSHDDLLQSQL